MNKVFLALFSLLPILFVFGVIGILITMFTSLLLTRNLGHVASWMIIPPLSLTGFEDPEKSVGSIGYTCGCVLLLICGIMHHMVLHAFITRDDTEKKVNFKGRAFNILSVSFFILSCLAGIVQALVPFQSDIINTRYGYGTYTQESLIHQTVIIIFWIAGATYTVLYMATILSSPQLQSVIGKNATSSSYKTKRFFAVLAFIFCGLSFVSAPLPAPIRTIEKFFHFASLSQWLSAISLLVFVALNSFDASYLLERLGIRVLFYRGSARKSESSRK